MDAHTENVVVLLPIPLDAETRILLDRFAKDVGKHPGRVAAGLLRDLLRDDADAHRSF